jgi:peptidoglycan-associated lipoprotein
MKHVFLLLSILAVTNLHAQNTTSKKNKNGGSSRSVTSEKKSILNKIVEADSLNSEIQVKKNEQQDLRLAEREFKAGNFFFAANHYKKYLESNRKNSEIIFRIGECYKYAEESKTSISWFLKAIKSGYHENNIHSTLAQLYQNYNNWEEAEKQYVEHLKYVPDDAIARWRLESMRLSVLWLARKPTVTIENFTRINTKYSDFGIADVKNNGIIFSSTRPESFGQQKYGRLGEDFSDLFESYVNSADAWTLPLPLSPPVNTRNNEGNPVLSLDGNIMLFTRCFQLKGGCKIFETRRENGVWSIPIQVSLFDDSVDVGHPALTSTGDKLYFTAFNAEGGVGGKDIWFSNRSNDGNWEAPVNLGPMINTNGDEMFPFINYSNSEIFFASNGHMGFGGLDIFKSVGSGTEWSEPENMYSPMNSGADDFNYFANRKGDKGYFVSTRPGGRGSDDIYTWNKIPHTPYLTGIILDDSSGKILPGSVVRLLMEDSTYMECRADSLGAYKFKIRPDNKYVLSAFLPNNLVPNGIHRGKQSFVLYYPFDTLFNTYNSSDPLEMQIDVRLKLVPVNEVLITDILYDFDSSSLRPSSMPSLDSLTCFLKKYSSISIKIHSHTDSRGSHEYNQVLSDKRAASVVDYLLFKGITLDRLSSEGHGEEFLINDCSDSVDCFEDGHQVNRRTTFSITKIDVDRLIIKYRLVTGQDSEQPDVFLYVSNGFRRPKPSEKVSVSTGIKKQNIRDLSVEDLKYRMSRIGESEEVTLIIYDWLWNKGVSKFEDMENLTPRLRQKLQKEFVISNVR